MYFTKWENIDRCGLTNEQISQIIESAITYHRFHLNIGLATGIRAAFAALGALGVDRNNFGVKKAEVNSMYCFAQAIEVVLAVQAIRGTLDFTVIKDTAPKLVAYSETQVVTVVLNNISFQIPAEVLTCPEERLFSSITVASWIS